MDQTSQKHEIAFIGDSTLDNVIWVEQFEDSTALLLEQKLGVGVLNLAADGFTSTCVLEGAVPTLSYSMRQKFDPFPIKDWQTFFPLMELEQHEDVKYVVLSVGGNDIRHILQNLKTLLPTIEKLHHNYELIVKEILKTGKKLIIATQYRPCLPTDLGLYQVYRCIDTLDGEGDALAQLNRVFLVIYEKIFQLARENQIPIIDQTRSYDYNNPEYYHLQIEPSKKGGLITCDLIAHVLEKFQFGEDESKLFSLIDSKFEIETNDSKFIWKL